MTYQFGTAERNAAADAIEASIGTTPIMKLRSGAVPANCAAADSGTVIATINLPSDWMSAASGGSKSLLGTWQDASADAAGTVGHFRIYDVGGTTCRWQGTVTINGSGGDITLDNNVLAAGQSVTITAMTLLMGGA